LINSAYEFCVYPCPFFIVSDGSKADKITFSSLTNGDFAGGDVFSIGLEACLLSIVRIFQHILELLVEVGDGIFLSVFEQVPGVMRSDQLMNHLAVSAFFHYSGDSLYSDCFR